MNVIKQKAYFDQEAADYLLQDFVKNRLDADTKNRLQSNELKLEDGIEYIRVQITGQAGTNDLIKNTSTQKTGVISFDKARLNEGEYLILKAMRLSFGTVAADGTDDPAQVYYNPLLRQELPAAVRGANLKIVQENKTLFSYPVADLLLDGVQQGSPKQNAYVLDNWKLIEAGRPFTVQLEYAEGLSIPAANATAGIGKWFVEIRLYGSSTIRK